MTVEEVQKAIEALKAQGMDEEEILAAFYAMYCDDKITAEQLEGLTMAMGYEFTEEFKNMSDEDKKHFGEEDENPDVADDEPAEGVTKEEVEDAKQYDVPDDKKEEAPEEENKEEKEPEESEEDRAKKLFGLK